MQVTEKIAGSRIKAALRDCDISVGEGKDDTTFVVHMDGQRFWVTVVEEPYGPLD